MIVRFFASLASFLRSLSAAAWGKVLIGLVALGGLYYGVGVLWIHAIDDDPAFAETVQTEPGQSRAVAMAAALVTREVDVHHWTPNDPFFFPGGALDRMPSFQAGVVAAVARFAQELEDELGRTRGSSQADADLTRAVGLLKYAPDIWVFDFNTSVLPTASSESQYRRAVRALVAYNQRLARGEAVFDTRADNLLTTLDRIAADVGSSSAALAARIEGRSLLPGASADRLFYDVKGRAYAYHLILGALRQDFAVVIEERRMGAAWDQMMESFAQAAALRPYFVFNHDPDSQFLVNHFANLGFPLMRGRVQLREITNILQK